MLNPIIFTERLVQDFLRYQFTEYPLRLQGVQYENMPPSEP